MSPHSSLFRHGRAKARSASLLRCPGHPRLTCRPATKTWMPGTSPGMTKNWQARLRSPAIVSVRCAAGFLQKFVDQRLADAAGDVLVDSLHRLAHGGVLLGR